MDERSTSRYQVNSYYNWVTCFVSGFFWTNLCLISVNVQVLQSSASELNGDDYYELGLSRYAQRDWEGAIAAFTQAIQINPGDRDAYYRRGFAYCKLGKAQVANSDFSYSSAIHPPAYCMNGVLRVDSSGMGFQPDPGELEKKGYELLQSGNIEQSVQVLQRASTIFRAQGEMLRYRKIQQTLSKLMRP